MISLWHRQQTTGRYNPLDRWIGLDYRSLFLDPVVAEVTLTHEVTHGILTQTTEFGQAHETILRFLPAMNHLSEKDKKIISNVLYNSQVFIQESSASLMEILHLANRTNKNSAILWAKQHMPDEYYNRFAQLLFTFKMSKRYREYFTAKIPHLALQTAIRKDVVENDLLSDPNKLIVYLEKDKNNPDKRFHKMIENIQYQDFICTKDEKEICRLTNIISHPVVSKQEIANFLNYLTSLAGKEKRFTISDIGDPVVGKEVIQKISQNTTITNININLGENGEFINNLEDLLFYKDDICTIMVNINGREIKKQAEIFTDRSAEASIVAFRKTGEKYIYTDSIEKISHLLNTDLKDKTLLVKWGLYNPGSQNLSYFDKARYPNCVIYNTIDDLADKFNKIFKEEKKISYLYMGASKNHPFLTLILKDSKGVLHWVTTFGNVKINDFLAKNKNYLIKETIDNIIEIPNHFNNTMFVWFGLPWKINWYQTIIHGRDFIYR